MTFESRGRVGEGQNGLFASSKMPREENLFEPSRPSLKHLLTNLPLCLAFRRETKI